MSYRDIITIEPDKRGGKPCIRQVRIAVYDVLGWLAAGNRSGVHDKARVSGAVFSGRLMP